MEGYPQTDQELGLLNEAPETEQQSPKTANNGMEETHDILLEDTGGVSCDGEGDDETAPLLVKTAKKKSKDKKSRREREKEMTGGKERWGINEVREESAKGDKKEKQESSSKEQLQKTYRDTHKPGKRDKHTVKGRKEGRLIDTDEHEEEIAKERKTGKAKDIQIKNTHGETVEGKNKGAETADGESIVKDGENGRLKGADDLKEVTKTEKKKDRQKDTETRDKEETVKEKNRREAKDTGQAETKDRGERKKGRGKGDTEKTKTKDREKIKDKAVLTEADTLEVKGTENIVKEKRGGGNTGEPRKREETATKRKKKEHRDRNTPEFEDRGGEVREREDQIKEKKRGDKDKEQKGREKDKQ